MNIYYSIINFTISEKAGLVINIPTLTPIIVVKAKPRSIPAPAQNKGSIATINKANALKIIKKAF